MADAYQQSPSDYTDPNTGNNVTVYSKSGKRYTETDYDHAVDKYYSGKPLNDFIIVPAGTAQPTPTTMLGKATQFFEQNINKPVQQMAKADDLAFGRAYNKVKGMFGGEPTDPNTVNIMRSIVPNSPEGYASALAQGGAALATGGMSGVVMPAALRAGAAGLGYLGGQIATRSYKDLTIAEKAEPIIQAGLSAAAEGAVGVFKSLVKASPQLQANNAVAGKVINLLETEAPQLRNQGTAGLEAYARTKDGLKNLTRVGVESLKDSVDEITTSFKSDFQHILGSRGTLSKAADKALDRQLVDYHKAVYELLDNIDDTKVRDASIDAIHSSRTEIENILRKELSKANISDPEQGAALRSMFNNYLQVDKELHSSAIILHLMRKSGGNLGFDKRRFQQEILNYIQDMNPSQYKAQSGLMKRLEQIAMTHRESSKQLSANVKIPFIGKNIPLSVPYAKTTHYSGMHGDLSGTAVSIPAMKEYLKER